MLHWFIVLNKMGRKVARLPQDIIDIIMFYKEMFEEIEAFWWFFDEIMKNLLVFL